MGKWTDTDYRRAFADGHARNAYVGSLIAERGLWVECPPLKFARNYEEIKQFTSEEKDVKTRAGIIEVKGQGRFFTDDVSEFPYDNQIVDTVESWEGKSQKPIAYVMVCMDNKACIVVPCSSHSSWRKKVIHDRKKDQDFEFYVADASVIRPFSDLLDFLEKKEREWNERNGPIAQWLEQGTHNASVGGSIPSRPTRR